MINNHIESIEALIKSIVQSEPKKLTMVMHLVREHYAYCLEDVQPVITRLILRGDLEISSDQTLRLKGS